MSRLFSKQYIQIHFYAVDIFSSSPIQLFVSSFISIFHPLKFLPLLKLMSSKYSKQLRIISKIKFLFNYFDILYLYLLFILYFLCLPTRNTMASNFSVPVSVCSRVDSLPDPPEHQRFRMKTVARSISFQPQLDGIQIVLGRARSSLPVARTRHEINMRQSRSNDHEPRRTQPHDVKLNYGEGCHCIAAFEQK